MSLAAGTKLSFYEVLAPIGAGAMGEVWRAKDTRLGREVAIKVLPEHFASDEERLRRFEREAKTLATVNHPNVAQIFGVDQVGDTCFLVLELVPGQNLDERLKKGPLSVEDALDICQQIALGLEAAHEAGVIHRDLKPANVRLTPDGQVKLLDFGLAKPASEGHHGSSTDSVLATEAGRLLGTPTYMAPEQARGKSIDKRVDVWAFGCVLYECLTGKRAFDGETLTDVLTSVMHDEIDATKLPAGVPARVRELLADCLVKDPRERARDIGEIRRQLQRARSEPSNPKSKRLMSRSTGIAIMLVATIASSVAGVLATKALQGNAAPLAQRQAGGGVMRVALAFPETDIFSPMAGMLSLALSPDGRNVAFCAERQGVNQLLLRRLSEREWTVVPGSAGAHNPFFSPDGQWIAFFAAEKLKKVSVHGGVPMDLCAATADRGGGWLDDKTIVLAPSMAAPLSKIAASGGSLEPLTQLDPAQLERTHRWPCVLPGGEWVLFVTGRSDRPAHYDRAIISAVCVKTGERRDVFNGASMVRYSPTGHLILARPGELFAAPFDLAGVRITGSELPVATGIESNPATGAVQFDVAADGTLAYLPAVRGAYDSELIWLDRSGKATPLPVPPQAYWLPRLSPDDSQAATCIGETVIRGDIWTLDLERAKLNRVTFDGSCAYPQWSPSGKELVYAGLAGGIGLQLRSLDQGAEPRVILKAVALAAQPTGFHPDGSGILFHYFGDPKGDIQFLPVDGVSPPRAIAPDAAVQWGGVLSPDGQWLAYVSNETGQDEVYVRSWMRPLAKWQVSNAGGLQPVWARGTSELFYVHGSVLCSLTVDLRGPEFSSGPARELFALPEVRGVQKEFARYDVTRDGQRFLTTRMANPDARERTIELVLGWSEELERLVPAHK